MSGLIIYFSRPGGNYVSGEIVDLDKGNTEVVAEAIQNLTGADIFKVKPVVDYDRDYSRCIEQAKNDQKRNARPQLLEYPHNLDKYTTIYLGYPNYWGTIPMHLFTLLEKVDLKGKTVKPFCTHEGSGMGRSLVDIKTLCSGATIKEVLAIQGGKVNQCQNELAQWIKE